MGIFKKLFLVAILGIVAACSGVPDTLRDGNDEPEIAALTQALMDLGPGIDPAEAARAARLSYEYTAVLKNRYQITDPPLIHNTKVNMGLNPRGLCWHWAEDMERRLDAESFTTLDMHRAIAVGRGVRIDHSTAIISRKGDPYQQGVVLDPWRQGGTLFFAPVADDTRYFWEAREVVLARRSARDEAEAGLRQ